MSFQRRFCDFHPNPSQGLLHWEFPPLQKPTPSGDIVDLLEINISSRPFLPFILYDAEEKIHSTEVQGNSSLIGHSLGALQLESELGIRVIAIRRKKRWLYDPEPGTVLRTKDRLVLRGIQDGFERLESIAMGNENFEPPQTDNRNGSRGP